MVQPSCKCEFNTDEEETDNASTLQERAKRPQQTFSHKCFPHLCRCADLAVAGFIGILDEVAGEIPDEVAGEFAEEVAGDRRSSWTTLLDPFHWQCNRKTFAGKSGSLFAST